MTANMQVKPEGRIRKGGYAGQWYVVIRDSPFPRWAWVHLVDESGHAMREIRREYLEES